MGVLLELWRMANNNSDEGLKLTVESTMLQKFNNINLQTLIESVLPDVEAVIDSYATEKNFEFIKKGIELFSISLVEKLEDAENAKKIIPYTYIQTISESVEKKYLTPSVQTAVDKFIPRALKYLTDKELKQVEENLTSDADDWDIQIDDWETNYMKQGTKWYDEDLAELIENEKKLRNEKKRMEFAGKIKIRNENVKADEQLKEGEYDRLLNLQYPELNALKEFMSNPAVEEFGAYAEIVMKALSKKKEDNEKVLEEIRIAEEEKQEKLREEKIQIAEKNRLAWKKEEEDLQAREELENKRRENAEALTQNYLFQYGNVENENFAMQNNHL